MAKLVDAIALEAISLTGLRVQVPPTALHSNLSQYTYGEEKGHEEKEAGPKARDSQDRGRLGAGRKGCTEARKTTTTGEREMTIPQAAMPLTPQLQPPMPATKTAFLSFNADINPTSTEGLLRACSELAQQSFQVVHLLLTTPGGSVMHGVTLYNMLRAFPFTLVTHNVGAVNSIGNVVFLAGKERYACSNSNFMFHGVGFDTPAGMRFEEKLLRERLDAIGADQAQIAAIIEQRATFADPAEIKELFLEARTKDPAYAKAKGIIHEIRDVQIPAGAPVFQLVFQR